MIPHPDHVRAALNSTFGWWATLTPVDVNGQPVSGPLPLTGGKLLQDGAAAVSRACSIDLAGEDVGIPTAGNLFTTLLDLGGRFALTGWVAIPGHAPHPVALGEFVVRDATWDRLNEGLTVEAQGLTSLVLDDRFPVPAALPAQTTQQRVQHLIGGTVPGATVTVRTTQVNHQPATVERDRLEAVLDTAHASGWCLLERPGRQWVVQDTSGDGIDTYTHPWTMRRSVKWRRDKCSNIVHARSTAEGKESIAATAQVTTGPYRPDGPFGRKPRFYGSPMINTVGEAQQAANTILARVSKLALYVDLDITLHPFIEPGDTVLVEVNGQPTTTVVEAVETLLTPGTQATRIATRYSGGGDEQETRSAP